MSISNDKVMDSIDKLHEKIDFMTSRVWKIDKVVAIQGSQIKRSESDIQNMKGFITKVTAGVGTAVSAFVTFLISFIRS